MGPVSLNSTALPVVDTGRTEPKGDVMLRRLAAHPGLLALIGLGLTLAGCKNGSSGGGGY